MQGDYISRVFAETVKNNAQGLNSYLICVKSNFNSALSRCEGFVTCQEAEALGFFRKEHFTEVAVTETDLAVFGNGAGNTEGLKTDTDICGSGSGGFIACALSLFKSDSRAYGVSPLCVFKADRLCFLNGGVGVNAVFCAYILALVNRRDTVIFKNAENSLPLRLS